MGRPAVAPAGAARSSIASQLLALGRQSLIYGLGPVISRFASLFLLPLYVHYLKPSDYGKVETLTALVAVGVTIAQLGLVNALFRFALERKGAERDGVIRTALATCAVSGLVLATLAALATPVAAPHLLGPGEQGLWLLSCAGLWISLVYEPTVGLYRVEQRPARYLSITVVNIVFTIGLSAFLVFTISDKAFGLVAGSYAGTAIALVVVLVDRRHVLYGKLDRAVLGPMLRFGLPFVPSRLALWGLSLSNRLFLLAFSTQAALGVLALGVRIGTSVALVVTAFQLAWPPFAYSIDDDQQARDVYRAALTWWCVLGSWLVLGLALLRHPVLSLFAHKWANAANPMALSEAGYAAYGAYYAVGVAVGRVKKTGLNWMITGIAAIANGVLCLILIPFWGATGAATATALSYLLAAVLMVWRSERVFAVGYERLRIVWVGVVAGVLFVAADQLPNSGLAIPGRFAIGLAFPLVLFATGWLSPGERQRVRVMGARLARRH
ncbi:MAG TPA: lipopolysaccharide biosynthesis protein [Gaiellales bacterium]